MAQVLEGSMTVSKDTEAMINARIAQIDHLLSIQLNEVLHHQAFQKLEASWRGLRYLLDQSETSDKLKIKVLNVSKKELLRDLQRAPEFDQSAMFKKVYEEEFGIFGGAPFAALVGDYEFGRGPEDMELLEKVSQRGRFGARAVPDGGRAGDVQHGDLSLRSTHPRDIAKIFDTTEYAKWKSFRQSEDSRYVGLCLPHVLGRLPYGKERRHHRGVQLRRGRGRHRPQQVPVEQRRLCPGRATDQFVRALRLVRVHPRRGGRRSGGGPALPTTSRPTRAMSP